MKLPAKGSNNYRILEVLYKRGPSRVAELAFSVRGMSAAQVDGAIKRCSVDGLVSHKRYVWELDQSVRRYFDGCAAYEDIRSLEIVPSRTYNVYEAKPLSAKYQISANGSRPGSNEFRNWPSKHLEAA